MREPIGMLEALGEDRPQLGKPQTCARPEDEAAEELRRGVAAVLLGEDACRRLAQPADEASLGVGARRREHEKHRDAALPLFARPPQRRR